MDMVRYEGARRKAMARGQRRFRAALLDILAGEPDTRATRLYCESERLIDRLEAEIDEALDTAREQVLAAWFEASHLEFDELLAADPDYPTIVWMAVEERARWEAQ